MKWALYLLFIIFLLPFTFAHHQPTTFIFEDALNHMPLSNSFYYLEFVDTQGVHVERVYSNTSQFNLFLDHKTHFVRILIDSFSTSGTDYYGETFINVSNPQTLLVFPVGSVEGIVEDEQKNIISDADIEISCTKNYVDFFIIKENSLGLFEIENLPLGDCRISAI